MDSQVQINPAVSAGLYFTPAPDQSSALEKSLEAQRLWVSGSDLAKRLEVLAALCLNATLRGETSLICASQELRPKVNEALRQMGLQGLYFDLSGHADSAVIGAFQVARRKRAHDATFRQAEVALSEFERWYKGQEQGYLNLEKVLFGELKWMDIVDQRSGVTGSAYQHFLTSAVRDRFDLTHKEYWHLRGRLKSFARLRTLRTPGFEVLDALNPALFEDPDASLKESVMTHLRQIVEVGREVLCVVADAIHAYRQDVTSDHQWRSAEITNRLVRVQQLIAKGETKHGPRFFDESTLSNTWHSLVKGAREDVRSLHEARNEVREAFLDFHNYLQECEDPHLGDAAALMPDPLTIDAIRYTCDEVNEMLNDWSIRADAHARENKKRLNAQNISRGEDLRELIRTAESRIEHFIALLSSAQILKTLPEVNALSIDKKALAIESTVRLCMRLLDATPDIDAYTLWSGFWSAQNARTKAVLKCLDLMEDSDIVQAFDTWYFGLTLAQIPDHSIVSDKTLVEEQHPQIIDLRAALEGHLRAMVQTQRYDVLREISSVQKNLIQSISKAHLNAFSDELRILPAKAIAGLFPVLICSREQVNEYSGYYKSLYVVSEDGHDYKTFAAQSRRCIMLSQSPPKSIPDQWVLASLDINPLVQCMDWRAVPTSDRLPFIETLASQFVPFLKGMRVYNARGVQIFSFLGDRVDTTLLQRLGMPYKETGENGLTKQHIVESFLDRKKPVIVLTRDQKMGLEFNGYLPWHRQTMKKIRECGVRVCNLWSLDLKNTPVQSLEDLYETVRVFAEEANAAQTENTNLERNAQPGSHAMERISQNPPLGNISTGI